MIKLDDKWRIEPDPTSGWRLIGIETKTRKNKETKEKEEYEAEKIYYYPKLQQILNMYIQQACMDSCKGSIQNIIDRLNEIEKSVEDVKRIYVANGKLIQT